MGISFTCDYNEGAHPLVLKRLEETNLVQEPGYGEDSFCRSAREKIRHATECPGAEVFFLTGGTQTNSTVIDAMIGRYEGVIAAETGHIAVHESGAVEFCGHKVITLPQHQGKIDPAELAGFLERFHSDPNWPHMVYPGMAYISFPTEYGTIYSKSEMESLHAVCRNYGIPLFVDGARLGYGLESDSCELTLPELARLCDVFYIGGTKVGALCGEAVVFPRGNVPPHFFTIVKQHGALLAKGRLLGIQFDTLFTDGLYFSISRHAIEQAMKVKAMFTLKGIPFHIDSPTNQQFPILTVAQARAIEAAGIEFEVWEQLPGSRLVTRFATSWATTDAQTDRLGEVLSIL